MYATTRLLGFESVSSSFFGTRAEQVPVKPTPDVQKLLDAAAKLPQAEQVAGYEKALDAAIAINDNEGARISIRELYLWLRTNRSKSAQGFFENLTVKARREQNRNLEALALNSVGNVMFDIGDLNQAYARFTESLVIRRELGDRPRIADMLRNLGIVHEIRLEFDKALTHYEEALQIHRSLGDKPNIAGSLKAKAFVFEKTGNRDKSLACHLESLDVWRELADEENVAQSLSNIADCHNMRGDYEKSLVFNNEAITVRRKLNDQSALALLLDKKADIHKRRKEYPLALSNLLEELEILRTLSDKSLMALVLNNLAIIHTAMGNQKLVVDAYEESLSISKGLKDKRRTSTTLTNFAVYCGDILNDTAQSKSLHNQSLLICRSISYSEGVGRNLFHLGRLHSQTGDSETALKMHLEALDISRKLKEKSGIAKNLYYAARIYNEKDDQQTSLELNSEALGILKDLRDTPGIVMCLDELSSAYFNAGNLVSSLYMCEQALMLNRELGSHSNIIKSLFMCAKIHECQGDFTKALNVHTSAYNLSKEHGDYSNVVICLANLAELRLKMRDLSGSLVNYTELLMVSMSNDDEHVTARALVHIARLQCRAGNYKKAKAWYHDAYVTYKRLDDRNEVGSCLNNLARINILSGEYTEALSTLKQVSSIFVNGSSFILAESLRLCAHAHFAMSNFTAASSAWIAAQLVFDELGDQIGIVETLCDEGESWLAEDNPNRAYLAFERAAKLNVTSTSHKSRVSCGLADAISQSGRYTESIDLIRKCIQDCKDSGTVLSLARPLCVLGRVQIKLSEFDSAKASILAALATSELVRDSNEIANALGALSELADRQGNARGATLFGRLAVQTRINQVTDLITFSPLLVQSKRLKCLSDCRNVAGLLVVQGRIAEFDQFLSLLKLLEMSPITVDIDQYFRRCRSIGEEFKAEKEYKQLVDELAVLGDELICLLSLKPATKVAILEQSQLLQRIEVAKDYFAAEVNRILAACRNVTSGHLETIHQSPTIKVQKKLQTDIAVLSMLCLSDRVLMVLRTSKFCFVRTARIDAHNLRKLVREIREVLIDPTKDAAPVLKMGYEALWKPIASDVDKLEVTSLHLSLDGIIRYIPIGALYDGRKYLAERFVFRYFSQLALESNAIRSSSGCDVCFFGVSVKRFIDEGFGRPITYGIAPYVRAEMSHVLRELSGNQSIVLDNQFSDLSVRKALQARPKVIHFATSVLIRNGSLSQSIIVTGNGNPLQVSSVWSQLQSPKQRFDLVTLSGCETRMTAESSDGREVENLSTGLRLQGVNAVVSTIWSVASVSRAEFVGMFYKLRNQNPQQTNEWCVHKAQVRMIRSNNIKSEKSKKQIHGKSALTKPQTSELTRDWSHPYYWSSFILTANPFY